MTKYEPLQRYLQGRSTAEVPLSFQDIEGIIGAPLPPVAFKHRAWWSNNPANSVITKAWLDAGFRTERVDMGGQKLVFRRAGADSAGPGPVHSSSGHAAREGRHPGWGALRGTVRVSVDVDLTAPLGEPWGGAEAG